MANVNSAFGARPVQHRNGAPYNGAARVYSIPSGDGTAVYIGDFVKLAGTGQTINGVVYSDVAQAATGNVILGVCVGVIPDTHLSTKYRVASTQRLLLVADDPDLLFVMQEGTGGTPLAVNDLGLNVNFAVASGSTVTGQSGNTINNATESTTNTLDLKLMQLWSGPDNAQGDSARWLVAINRHQFADQILGV